MTYRVSQKNVAVALLLQQAAAIFYWDTWYNTYNYILNMFKGFRRQKFCFLSPIQNSIATRTSGQWQLSPQMVTVKYQEKNGSQQIRNAPITTPRVTNACKYFELDVIKCNSLNPWLWPNNSWLNNSLFYSGHMNIHNIQRSKLYV